MSTVATMIENAERISKDRALAKQATQTPRQLSSEGVQNEREVKKDDVSNEAVFRP